MTLTSAPRTPSSTLRREPGQADLIRAVVAGLALVAGALLVVRLADVLLMIFGSVLVAVLLHALADPLQRRLRLPRAWALGVSVAAVVLAATAIVWLFGQQAALQLSGLAELLPKAWAGLHARLDGHAWAGRILSELDDYRLDGSRLIDIGPRLAANAGGLLAGVVIVSFAGLYIAFHPEAYVRGLLLLIPRAGRAQAETVLAESGQALRQWLIGQLLSMALVGATTAAGLALAGVPSPLALGVIAGLGQFVPVIGPMAATIPGLLAALAAGPQTFGWAVVVYVAASQLEANLFTPLMLRQMAQLPMAITLFAVLAMGVLLGPLGVLFATPLAVVLYVVVRRIYVAGLLGESLN